MFWDGMVECSAAEKTSNIENGNDNREKLGRQYLQGTAGPVREKNRFWHIPDADHALRRV